MDVNFNHVDSLKIFLGLSTVEKKIEPFVILANYILLTQTSKSESAFAKDGFCTWSKALASNGGFRLHDKTEDHLLSCQRWKDRTNIANKKAVSIDNQLDPDRLSVVAEHREYITSKIS